MAFHADTVWEVRTSGNNNNGGGWRDGGGGSVDYSQQDVAQLNLANCSVSGTTLTDDDAGGVFTAAMVWNVVNIVGDERRQIISFTDANNVELDAAPGDASGLTINVGGAVADLEEIDSLTVFGNTIYIKAGTYASGGTISTGNGGYGVSTKHIIGYNIARDDDPVGNDRPLLTLGANAFTRGAFTHMKHLRFTQGASTGIVTADFGINENIKITKTSGGTAFKPGATDVNIQCEVDCSGGIAVDCLNDADTIFKKCYIHDSNIGIQVKYKGFVVTDCIFDTITTFAISLFNTNVRSGFNIEHNSFYNCVDGISAAFACTGGSIRNNQFTDGTDGIHFVTASHGVDVDYNNYYNNSGNDVTGVNKGPNATANDPGYGGAGAGNFSGVDDTDGEVLLYGVG